MARQTKKTSKRRTGARPSGRRTSHKRRVEEFLNRKFPGRTYKLRILSSLFKSIIVRVRRRRKTEDAFIERQRRLLWVDLELLIERMRGKPVQKLLDKVNAAEIRVQKTKKKYDAAESKKTAKNANTPARLWALQRYVKARMKYIGASTILLQIYLDHFYAGLPESMKMQVVENMKSHSEVMNPKGYRAILARIHRPVERKGPARGRQAQETAIATPITAVVETYKKLRAEIYATRNKEAAEARAALTSRYQEVVGGEVPNAIAQAIEKLSAERAGEALKRLRRQLAVRTGGPLSKREIVAINRTITK